MISRLITGDQASVRARLQVYNGNGFIVAITSFGQDWENGPHPLDVQKLKSCVSKKIFITVGTDSDGFSGDLEQSAEDY